VEITALLRNLCGQEHETVDYSNKIMRQIYAEIHPDKEDALIQLLEDADPLNDGRVEPQGLKSALKKVCKQLDEETIDRFIRFLDKDKSGKIQYMDFIQRMAEVSNRDHNPFKSVVQRLNYFLQSNQQTPLMLLKRLKKEEGGPSEAVSVPVFGQFLKSKVDKKRDEFELRRYASYMDVDKDGYISEEDLKTCIANLHNNQFFKNSGEALQKASFSSQKKFYPQKGLPQERAIELCKQIRTALINQKIAYREAFNRFDANKDGFLSYAEFSEGIDKVLKLSEPIKEKLFALMDKYQLGMVDYPNFLEVIQTSSASGPSKKVHEDNFDWEEGIVEKIKQYIYNQRVTPEEAFKAFDRDFDGIVNKTDLKWALENLLEVKPEQILPTKLDRLFRLLDFYKTGAIQPSDLVRLITNENPYASEAGTRLQSANTFRKTLGGSFQETNTFDWKLSAIQQIGLIISKQYKSLQESFLAASEHF